MGLVRGGAVIALMLAGCGGARPAPKTPEAPVGEGMSLTAADLDRLHALAPDYVARAERAEQRASEAQTAEAASEHHACAQLLLEAAQAEADRVELERALLAEDFRRDAVLREVAREEYARLARERAGELPPPELPAADATRSAPAGAPEAQRMAAGAYIRRARLSLAAARAMGAEPAAIASAERRIRDAASRPAEARGALEQAERVLDSVRTRNTPAPQVH
jgi:hypothetical protein